ncbi:FadR/GntR family transcriptional regulator [Actinomadura sp. 3N508]|uniref:FadR/GntR family transcriptional regulator n=1 Tax=Actinomadura sp. 3N508 TaxID=3375153 RepID=UPI0037A702C0
MLEPLSRRPVPDVIAERLTVAIANGDLRPGEKLPNEPELARRLGVGRTSLRQALRQLQLMGVVKVVRGRGTYVCDPPEDNPTLRFLDWSARNQAEVGEILETRMALETTAAGLASVRADDAQIAELAKLSAAHDDARHTGDVDALVETDERFHHALLSISGNAYMTRVYEMLVPQLQEFRRRSLSLSGAPERSAGDHDAIVAAIAARDARESRRQVVRHLWTLYKEVRTLSAAGPDHPFPEHSDTFA